MTLDAALLITAIFAVAVLYSSVGHGGASGYLAVMAIAGVLPELTRPTALMLNLFVASIAFIQFSRNGHFDRTLFLPFALGSVPLAFVGGLIKLPAPIYKIVLGVCLIIAALRLAIHLKSDENLRNPTFLTCLLIGAILGLVSGLVGVGGGIFLTPILLLMRWTDAKTAAGVSALFILVNSVSGLLGNYAQVMTLPASVFTWIGAAIIGGVLGATLGSFKFDSILLRRVLACGLVIAGGKLIFT